MTSKVTIKADSTNNGDVHVRAASHWTGERELTLFPGDEATWGVTDTTIITVTETCPSKKQRASVEAK